MRKTWRWLAFPLILGVSITAVRSLGKCPAEPAASPPEGSPRQIIFYAEHEGDVDIYFINSDGSFLYNITKDSRADDTLPRWLPDGSLFAFVSYREERDGAIYLADVNGSNLHRLGGHDTGIYDAQWSPDMSSILFTDRVGVYSVVHVMDADGTNVRALTPSEVNSFSPMWSLDGRQIVYYRPDGLAEPGDIYVLNADGSDRRNLTDDSARDEFPTWSPDGSQILFISNRDHLSFDIYEPWQEIYVMDADGSNLRRLTNNNADDGSPSWSPDGSQIAFTSNRDSANGTYDIYVMDADGDNVRQLTCNDSYDYAPAWSPDGEEILFTSTRDGNGEIYVMFADGSNELRLTDHPADDYYPQWRP